ncbi:hypothetical protein EYR36_008671 [Pleurotus pulmonarius]|nr:hypothetical protein EYR36_008671 [Pleurotus pulmonarius]
MLSYIARIFSALWTVVYALLTLATHNDSAIVQLVALLCCTKGIDGPAIANLRDITLGSSLSSLGHLSTLEELEEEEDFDAEEREANSGAEAIRHGHEDTSHPSQSWLQDYDAEGGYKTGSSSDVGHHDYVKTLLVQGDVDKEAAHHNFDALSKLQELTVALSRFSIYRLSTIEEFDEEEEARIAWIRSYDGTTVPVGLRQAFAETKECGYHDTGGGSVTLVESPSLQAAQCRQLAHEGFDSDATSPFAFSATYIKKTDAISFDDWSRSSVSPPPTPTYESPCGGQSSMRHVQTATL